MCNLCVWFAKENREVKIQYEYECEYEIDNCAACLRTLAEIAIETCTRQVIQHDFQNKSRSKGSEF